MPYGQPARAPWRRGDRYSYLLDVERAMFAWEWLRRTDAYRAAWQTVPLLGEKAGAIIAHRFGLVQLVSPALSAMLAKPIWRASHDPRVIPATACSRGASVDHDLLDIRQLAELAAIALDDEDIEHWRLGTAEHSLRLDVRAGTLLGGPTLLQFELKGLARVRPQLGPIKELIDLRTTGINSSMNVGNARRDRWILELRTADAIAAGANHQKIARGLFTQAVEQTRWRLEADSVRSRTRRLVRAAGARLADPLDDRWFR